MGLKGKGRENNRLEERGEGKGRGGERRGEERVVVHVLESMTIE